MAHRKHHLAPGDQYGRLTLIKETYACQNIAWRARCACGGTVVVQQSNIVAGRTTSCGCFKKERTRLLGQSNRTHGSTYSLTWMTWQAMIRRCTSKTSKDFKRYGALGIKVCRRWLVYENFIADIGPRPGPEYSIDRFPNNAGGYGPDNCRWATSREQGNNRRSNTYLTVDGRSQTISNWSLELGLRSDTICARLKRGWSTRDALRPIGEVDKRLK
jgi:hypothetical protein